jgi:hypothetical protein
MMAQPRRKEEKEEEIRRKEEKQNGKSSWAMLDQPESKKRKGREEKDRM